MPDLNMAKSMQNFSPTGGIASILELTKEIKIDPDNAALYAERSECFRIIQQHYHARKDAERVISLRPDWFKGYYYKGLAEFGAEHFKTAVESFEDGLQYNADDDDMISALQKASRAWLMSKINERTRVIKGLVLGCVVGALALAANDWILPSPIVKNIFLKIFLFAAWGFCGTELAKNYSKMLETDRNKRLEAPDELFPFSSDSSTPSRSKPASSSMGTSTDGLTSDGGHSDVRPRRGRRDEAS